MIRIQSQILRYIERNCMHYLGQMDLNAKSEIVWEYYEQTLKQMKAIMGPKSSGWMRLLICTKKLG